MKKGIIITLVVVVGLGIASMVITKDFSVSRSTVIEADKATVMAVLGDFNHFSSWDPWSEMDPNIEITTFGEPREVGHGYTWSGNADVGSGSQEIKSISDNEISIELKFQEPMEATSSTSYTVNEVSNGTEVIWTMSGSVPYFFALIGDMESELGSQFDQGLGDLKSHIEEMDMGPSYEIAEVDMPAMHFVGHREMISMSDMDDFWSAENVGALYGAVSAVSPNVGYLAGLYYVWDEEAGQTDMARAVIVDSEMEVPGFSALSVAGGRALKLTHYGDYESIGDAHMAMERFSEEGGFTIIEPVMEIYRVGGEDVPMEEWVTDVYYPLADPAAS